MRSTVVSATLLIAALALGGCSAIDGLLSDEPARGADGQVTEASTQDAFALKVGDCFDSSELGDVVEQVPFVPCDESHDAEVYASTQLDDGDYPGDQEAYDTAWAYCEAEFAEFIGTGYADSELDLFPMYPTEDGWDSLGDREVLCIVTDLDGTTGSLRGANR